MKPSSYSEYQLKPMTTEVKWSVLYRFVCVCVLRVCVCVPYSEAVISVDEISSTELGRTEHEVLQTPGGVVFLSLNLDLSVLLVHDTPLKTLRNDYIIQTQCSRTSGPVCVLICPREIYNMYKHGRNVDGVCVCVCVYTTLHSLSIE